MSALTPLRKRLDGEEGVVVVIFALVLVVLFAAVAFAVDLSRLYHQRQVLQNAVDFGALAGAQELPVQGSAQASTAAAEALKVTLANAPEIAPTQVAIAFRCIVGDRDGDGAPDVDDVPAVCGPKPGRGPRRSGARSVVVPRTRATPTSGTSATRSRWARARSSTTRSPR